MKPIPFFDDDALDDLLRPPSITDRQEKLRQRLAKETTTILLRRRWLRRLRVAAAMAACYLAGLATMSWLAPQPAITSIPPAQRISEAPRTAEARPQNTALADSSAIAMEWQALEAIHDRPNLYRRAGDRYLEETGDIQSALRCYRQFLDSGSDSDRIIAPQDSWLLMALKEARQPSRPHSGKDS
jgi:hypothetical protein